MAYNKPLEMCKNALCHNERGCFKLFVKSTLYSTIILRGRGHQKALSLTGDIYFVGGAETPSSAWPNFFSADFRPTDNIRRRRRNPAAQKSTYWCWPPLMSRFE